MLRSVQELRDWLERHGTICESRVEILEKSKPRYFISYSFYWNGEKVAAVCYGHKTERACLQSIYNDCINFIITGKF